MKGDSRATINVHELLVWTIGVNEVGIGAAGSAADTGGRRRLRDGGAYQPEIVKRARRLQVTATEIHVSITVDLVGSGFGHRIDDKSAGLAVFSVVIVGENLEFLDLVH